MDLRITSTPTSDTRHHLALAGELDLASEVRAREALVAVLEPGRLVELDLDGITFMDSTGARFLTWAGSTARGGGADVAVVALSRQARRLLQVARAEDAVRRSCRWPAANEPAAAPL